MNIRYEVLDFTKKHGYVVYRFPVEHDFTLDEMLPVFMELDSGRFVVAYDDDGEPQTIDLWIPPRNSGDAS